MSVLLLVAVSGTVIAPMCFCVIAQAAGYLDSLNVALRDACLAVSVAPNSEGIGCR
jgi:hypothetical protein